MSTGLKDIIAENNPWVFMTQVILVLGPIVGFIYGAAIYYRKKVAMFNKLVVSALGCMMLGRFYEVAIWYATDSLQESFNLAVLGDLGCFLFLLSASYGQMDGLVDGREKKYLKYRLISLLAPLLIFASGIILYILKKDVNIIFTYLIIFLAAMFSSYFNMKHLIFPDVDFGILKSIRGYNALTLFGTFSFIILSVGGGIGSMWLFAVGAFLTGAWAFAVIPVLKGGSSKWTL